MILFPRSKYRAALRLKGFIKSIPVQEGGDLISRENNKSL
jgi:hypothetical protein